MLIICVIGLPGSGKSTFAKVGQEMGYKYIRMGECVLEEARKMGWKTEGNPDFRFVEFADEMRKERGDTFAADLTSGWIHENCELDDILFVDGCRSIDEYAVFRDMFNNVKMIACESDLPIKDCFEDNMIIIKELEVGELDKIYQQGNCVFIEVDLANQTRCADKFIYDLLGI